MAMKMPPNILFVLISLRQDYSSRRECVLGWVPGEQGEEESVSVAEVEGLVIQKKKKVKYLLFQVTNKYIIQEYFIKTVVSFQI